MISSLRLNLSSLICIRLTHEIRQNDMHWRWGEVEVTVRVCYFTQQREVLQVDCPKMSANENVWCVSTESLSQTKWFIPTSFLFSQWKAMGTRLGSFKWLFNPRSARGRSDSPSRMYTRKCASRGERGAGGGVLNKVLHPEASQRCLTSCPLYTIFDREDQYPFCIPSVDKLYPFHIPCLELCIPLNCCKYTVFKILINHTTRSFHHFFFTTVKCNCKPLFTDPNDRFP